MWFRMYIKGLVLLVLTLVLYVGILPKAISAQDSLLVVGGIFIALAWPAVVALFIRRQFRKYKQCAKF